MRHYLRLFIMLLAVTATAAAAKPLVLVYPPTPEKETSPEVARDAASALKRYLNESGRVEALVFDIESRTVKRAIAEKAFTADEAGNVSTPDLRLKIAKAIGANYAATGDILHEKNTIALKVWFAQIKPPAVWEGGTSASVVTQTNNDAATSMNVSNAIQNAASQIVCFLVNGPLNGLPVESETNNKPALSSVSPVAPQMDPAKRIEQADALMKAGNTAQAISEYREAVNSDPKNISARIKLAKAYVERSMPEYATEELKRALQFDPENTEIPELLAAIREPKTRSIVIDNSQTTPEEPDVKPVTPQPQIQRPPVQVVKEPDQDAETLEQATVRIHKQIQENPKNPQLRESLALVFATRGMLPESRAQILEMNKLISGESEGVITARYARFKKIADNITSHVLKEFSDAASQFRQGGFTREGYFDKIGDLTLSIDNLTKFMSVLAPPASEAKTHKKRLIAFSLVSQYGATMQSYLLTNDPAKREAAESFLEEGKKVLESASSP